MFRTLLIAVALPLVACEGIALNLPVPGEPGGGPAPTGLVLTTDRAGDVLTVHVGLAEPDVAALQLTLEYDPTKLAPGATSPAEDAVAAGKTVSGTRAAPLRVVAFGLDERVLEDADGDGVSGVASVEFTVLGPDEGEIRAVGVVASDALGNAVLGVAVIADDD